MKRKPGETVQELVSRIQQDAVTYDFQSFKDPLDEALRTSFICCVENAVVLKALFKLKDDELTLVKAYQVAQETEEVAKVAKLMGQHLSQCIKWYSQRARPIHLELLYQRPRTHLRGGWISHFPRNPVAGVGRRIMLVNIVHT